MTNKDSSKNGQAEALEALLGTGKSTVWWRRPAVWIGVILLALLGAGATYWWTLQKAKAQPSYVTEAVRKGNITLRVSANGTLQPTRAVNVGSELSGTVKRVVVDVNQQVKKGQLLVELDTAKLLDQVQRSRAGVASAQANLKQASVVLQDAKAKLARFEEVFFLSAGKVPSALEMDGAKAAVEKAIAAHASAAAGVSEASAVLSTDQTNLTKAAIKSPIDGVVLSRSVDPGNAVAASLQAVTLFSIGEDLRKLRLEVNVDEADVGQVKEGQRASFTVSAYPNRRYPATLVRVAYGSTKTDNVITYTTYLDVDNSDLSLRPGMTATASIVAVERKDVLLVPNMALRFTPGEAASGGATKARSGIVSSLIPSGRPGGQARKTAGATRDSSGIKQVWLLKPEGPVAVKVKVGISDGRNTEVSAPELADGTPVIVAQNAGSK